MIQPKASALNVVQAAGADLVINGKRAYITGLKPMDLSGVEAVSINAYTAETLGVLTFTVTASGVAGTEYTIGLDTPSGNNYPSNTGPSTGGTGIPNTVTYYGTAADTATTIATALYGLLLKAKSLKGTPANPSAGVITITGITGYPISSPVSTPNITSAVTTPGVLAVGRGSDILRAFPAAIPAAILTNNYIVVAFFHKVLATMVEGPGIPGFQYLLINNADTNAPALVTAIKAQWTFWS